MENLFVCGETAALLSVHSVPTNNSFLTSMLCLYAETSFTIPKHKVWSGIKSKHGRTPSISLGWIPHLIHIITDLSHYQFNLKSIKTSRKAV